ncbi:MAG: hypothetical protein KF797_02130 [Flavobacteriales bacterium]|nr:hypothetical protein [Flavobacteriales bacterium]
MASNSQQRVKWHLVPLLSLGLWLMPGRMAAQDPDTLVIHKARNAISRGLAYFSHPSRNFDPDAALLYTYLKDRFDLPGSASAQNTVEHIKAERQDQSYMFLRMAEPRPCEMHFLDPQGPNDVALVGLWYDQLEDRSLLMDRIKETEQGWDEPYAVTHALWAMAMAKHCFQAELDTAVERRLVKLNLDIMARNRPLWNDVVIEALAMAQYHDPSYVPPAEYIHEITGLQNPNGSWSWVAKDPTSQGQRTTILALWALLQYQPLAWPQKPRPMALPLPAAGEQE